MDIWGWLLNILIVLSAALVLGTISEQLKQSSIIGYLLAGMLVGPSVLGWVDSGKEVHAIAELGVTLLLFSLGLEFSLTRLIRLGPITYVGGAAQILVTAFAGYAVAGMLGLSWQTSIALGLIVSLSSTACVVRVLKDDFQLDSLYGRNAIGILLIQDLAVVFLALVTLSLSGESNSSQAIWGFSRTVGLGLLMFAGFYLVINYIIPNLFLTKGMSRNRELPILLAVVMSLGSAWAAHQAGLSPSIGAFLAGILLAESPFALQIRADISSIRTLLLTLFFASIGMLVDPAFILQHALLVGCLVFLIVFIKPLIIWVIVRFFCVSNGQSLATGVCLGQVGEFSFVLAQIAAAGAIIDEHIFEIVVSVTVITLFLTPYMVRTAPILARWTESLWPARVPSLRSKSQRGP
ncbi:MAG: cation:proton antiporter, partial [Gemmatimonadota bacterium]|nr:cation:proton antiporter [Gemmatimonadota bacterium]